MQHILSVQSHVVYGYVGNRAVVFPLQCLGFEVSVINTVQFSKHTGYGPPCGEIVESQQIKTLFEGAFDLISTHEHALLTGYVGSPEIAHTIIHLIETFQNQQTQFIYCCDPVIGDQDRGIFVKPGVGESFKNLLIRHATILTPNQFELAYLTDLSVGSVQQIQFACEKLLSQGSKMILVTSVINKDLNEDDIGILLYTSEGSYLSIAPKFLLDIPPNGAGDLTAALFLGHLLKNSDPKIALLKTTRALYQLFKKTYEAGTRELRLIESQAYFSGIQANELIRVLSL